MRRSVRRRLLRRRIGKFVGLIAAVAALGALVLGVVLPPVIKSRLEHSLGLTLRRPVTIGHLSINPFRLSTEVRDFAVGDRDAAAPLVTWRRLYLRLDLLKSLRRAWVLDAIELDGLRGRLEVRPDGSSNISDLLAANAPTAAPGAPGRPLRIGALQVLDAQVEFTDRSLAHPFHTVVGPMTFKISGFETSSAEDAPYHFEATTEAGEKLAWSGTIVAAPFASRGRFALGGVVLKKYFPYLEGRVKAELAGGIVGASGRYAADFNPKARELQLSDAEIHLRDLELRERNSPDAAVRLKAVDVTGLAADALTGRAKVGKVALTGGTLLIRRRADGSLNLRSLVPAAGPKAAAPAALPDVRVGEVTISQVDVTFSDETLPQHPTLGLTGIQVAAKDFSVAGRGPIPVQAGFKWAPEGSASATGTVTLQPGLRADLELKLKRFALLPLSPYLEAFMHARVGEGSVSTNSAVHLDLGDQPAATVTGDVSFDRFGLVEADHNHEFLGFSWMALGGLALRTAPQFSATVREVELSGPFLRANLTPDHGLNLTAFAGTGRPAGAPSGPPPQVEIGKVEIDGGEFSFSDQTISPNVRVTVSNLGGTISGLSLDHVGRAALDLKGRVGGSGPVALTGSLDLAAAQRQVDLVLTVRDVDLLPLGPYAGKYAGYGLARGQLVIDSKVKITGAQVDSTNVVTLNQFTFGAASGSREATKLPVRLGVALLKDSAGRIVIDLPVQGSLDDPNFRVGRVVWRVISNLLTKAAVSPFALVGSMFGGGGDELAYQEFDPGRSALRPAEQPKLDTLARALANRPALNLGVAGSFDRVADTYALRRQRFEARVRHAVWEAQHAANPNIPPPDQLEIAPAARTAAIKQLFDAAFPPGTEFGTPLPPPPVVAPPPAGPPPPVLVRFFDLVTFKAQREAAAAQREAAARAAVHQQAVAAAVAAGLPEDEMSGRLAEAIPISTDDLAALAQARAEHVRQQLIDGGHIGAGRIFLATPTEPAAAEGGPRVLLTLE